MHRSHQIFTLEIRLAPLLICQVLLLACASGCAGTNSADTDGDGLSDQDEIDIHGTSPVLADTDGDGFSDGEEVTEFGFSPDTNNYKFNPLIADVPKIGITLTSDPDIDLIYTDTDGVAITRGTSRDVTEQSTLITTNASTNGTKVEDTHAAGGKVGAGVDAMGKPSASGELNYKYTNVTTKERASGWTQTQIDDHKEVVSEVEIVETQHAIATSGGSIAYSVTIQNEGNIAFTLTSLTLSVQSIDPDYEGRFKPVGNLDLDTTFGSFPATSMGPGGSAQNLVFANRNLDTGTIRDMLANSTGLVTEVAAYEVVDGDGRPYVHDETAIAARAAMVLIEYAPTAGRLQEQYAVATNADPDALGITVREAMQDILDVPYTTAEGVLTEVRDVAAESASNGLWLALHIRGSDVDRVVDVYDGSTPYDFDSLELKAGQVLHLVHLNDADMDGLGDRQEAVYGTDPLLVDTDSDSLSDLEEVTPRSINVDGRAVDVRSDPTLPDGDGDGISDAEEITPLVAATQPTNPRATDTEGDGLADGIDPYPATTDMFDITGLETAVVSTGAPTITLTWGIPIDSNSIATGVLWLSYYQNDLSEEIPEPETAPADGVIYLGPLSCGALCSNGWKLAHYSNYNTTPQPGPTESFVDSVDALASGTFRYIAYVNVDIDGDGFGDMYVRSGQSETVPMKVPTTTVKVSIDGIDLIQCRDFLSFGPLACVPYCAANDYSCELYWNFNGSSAIIPETWNLAEDPTGSLGEGTRLLPGGQIYTLPDSLGWPAIEFEVPQANGQCKGLAVHLYESDDTVASTAGDEYAHISLEWCHDPTWAMISGEQPEERIVTMAGGNYSFVHQRGASDRTQLRLRFHYSFTTND